MDVHDLQEIKMIRLSENKSICYSSPRASKIMPESLRTQERGKAQKKERGLGKEERADRNVKQDDAGMARAE